MGISFRLEEIVVVALLVKEVHVVVLAVVADLLYHIPHASLVLADQLDVF